MMSQEEVKARIDSIKESVSLDANLTPEQKRLFHKLFDLVYDCNGVDPGIGAWINVGFQARIGLDRDEFAIFLATTFKVLRSIMNGEIDASATIKAADC